MEFLLLLDSPEFLQSRPFKACQMTLLARPVGAIAHVLSPVYHYDGSIEWPGWPRMVDRHAPDYAN